MALKTIITAALPVDSVEEGNLNVRQSYNERALDELGRSLSAVGTLQPVLVQPRGRLKYELIVGSRRLRAAKKAGLKRIPAVVLEDVNDQDKLVMALSENLHRENLTPFEEAVVITKLLRKYKMEMGDLARKIGRGDGFIRRRIQLLSLPREVQEQVSYRKLSVTHAEVLSGVKKAEEQVELARMTVAERLSPQELLTHIKEEHQKPVAPRKKFWEDAGKKITLRIIEFSKWLQGVVPEVAKLSNSEIALVKHPLQDLKIQALEAIREIEAAYKRCRKS